MVWRIVLVLLCLGADAAYSEPPSPAPTKATDKQKTKAPDLKREAGTNQPVTEQPPAPVGMGSSATGSPHSDKKDDTKRDSTSSEWWLVYITGALVAATIGLMCYTARLWRETQESVRLAREEFISTHRPKIILRDAICTDNEIGNQIVVSYTLVNIGETRARIVLWGAEVQLITDEAFDLPQAPPMAEGWHEGFGGAVLEPGEERTGKHYSVCRWRTDDGSRHAYEEQRRGLFFCGHLVYEDDRNIRRHTAFWRKYDLTTSRFYLVNHPTLTALDYAD